MKIVIEVISHDKQRYPTVGDWQWDLVTIKPEKGTYEERLVSRIDKSSSVTESQATLQIKVSNTGSQDFNFLIALHEMIEAYMCIKDNISEQEVDKWDMDHLDSADPGSLPDCPYREQHMFAEYIEKSMAWGLKVDWNEYEKVIDSLFDVPNLDYTLEDKALEEEEHAEDWKRSRKGYTMKCPCRY